MGKSIPLRDYSTFSITGMMKPIVFCNNSLDIEAHSLNIQLAKALNEIKPNRRSTYIKQVFQQTINQLPSNSVIQDYDVLFNPLYKVDILKMMVAVCKVKPFDIVWAGKYCDGKLIYSEEGMLDYKVYNIKDYDITCIV